MYAAACILYLFLIYSSSRFYFLLMREEQTVNRMWSQEKKLDHMLSCYYWQGASIKISSLAKFMYRWLEPVIKVQPQLFLLFLISGYYSITAVDRNV
jgi:hypothetical protein